eukprot:3042352-Prorocentrum_lima.AAC.1
MKHNCSGRSQCQYVLTSHARRQEEHVLVVYKKKLEELNQQHAANEATLIVRLRSQRAEVK